jgi:hypothetical protein
MKIIESSFASELRHQIGTTQMSELDVKSHLKFLSELKLSIDTIQSSELKETREPIVISELSILTETIQPSELAFLIAPVVISEPYHAIDTRIGASLALRLIRYAEASLAGQLTLLH